MHKALVILQAYVAIGALVAAAYSPCAAEDKAVQIVQVDYQHRMTMNGQVINGMPSRGSMMGGMMKGMLGNMVGQQVGSLVGNVLSHALMGANPILAMAANLIMNKVTSQIQQKMTSSIGVPQLGVKEIQADTVTTTLASSRSRIDAGLLSTIVQCDQKQMIVINNDKHTFAKKSFDELVATFSGAMPSQMSWRVDETVDTQTETIAGLAAHHQVQTVTVTGMPSSAAALGNSGPATPKSMKMITEEWLSSSDIPDKCAMARNGGLGFMASLSASPQPQAVPTASVAASTTPSAARTIQIPLRLVKHISMEDLPQMPKDMPNGAQMPDIGALLSSRVETTAVKEIPYDPAAFEVPSGYTEDDSLIKTPTHSPS